MNEIEWPACGDPISMLLMLHDKASERKLRLFACACCHRACHLLNDERSRRIVDVVERYVDGQASKREFLTARQVATAASRDSFHRRYVLEAQQDSGYTAAMCKAYIAEEACRAAEETASPIGDLYAGRSSIFAASCIGKSAALPLLSNGEPVRGWISRVNAAIAAEEIAQASILRDFFGDDCPLLRYLNAVELAWPCDIARNLAHVIYEERAFDRLPILADALEEAGRADSIVLRHLRDAGPHYRGCWALDLILGKS